MSAVSPHSLQTYVCRKYIYSFILCYILLCITTKITTKEKERDSRWHPVVALLTGSLHCVAPRVTPYPPCEQLLTAGGGCCHHRPLLLVPLFLSSDSSPIHTSLPPYKQLLVEESGAMVSSFTPHSCCHPVLPPSRQPWLSWSPSLLLEIMGGDVTISN